MSAILKPLKVVLEHFPKRTFTIFHPYEALKLPERTRGRIRLDMEKCTGCGVCAYICPNVAIELVTRGEKKYPKLDYGRCCFCTLCVDYCPRTALSTSPAHELAEFSRAELDYAPERLAQPPQVTEPRALPRRKTVSIKKIDRRGVSHR